MRGRGRLPVDGVRTQGIGGSVSLPDGIGRFSTTAQDKRSLPLKSSGMSTGKGNARVRDVPAHPPADGRRRALFIDRPPPFFIDKTNVVI